MLWCGNGEGVVRTAHPALEGTNCGRDKVLTTTTITSFYNLQYTFFSGAMAEHAAH